MRNLSENGSNNLSLLGYLMLDSYNDMPNQWLEECPIEDGTMSSTGLQAKENVGNLKQVCEYELFESWNGEYGWQPIIW